MTSGEPALVLRARRLRAARGVVVARDVSLTASAGDVVAVEGRTARARPPYWQQLPGWRRPARSPRFCRLCPERAGVLPRMALQQWLAGLARTSGLTRTESARCTGDLLDRLGLAHTSAVPLQALSRGNAQRALVAQALIAEPDLLILDEPTGGLDDDGVTRVVAEIERAASRRAVVPVARHPTAPLPLPPGVTWRLRDGRVDAMPRETGPALQAAAFTAIALVPVMTWLAVLGHRVDGRELGRAFAAHAGGRARAHLATDLGLVPFALALTAAALIWPLVTQGSQPHPPSLDLKIIELHLAAALFGVGLGSALALVERAGWRLITAVALFLLLILIRPTPLTPLLRMSTHSSTLQTSVTDQVAWLCLPGLLLVAAAALIVTRLT
jgi:energy-coupling factor transporter ATP-binding protein EcfA2